MSHRTDRADILKQLHICGRVFKGIVTNNSRHWLAAKLTKPAGVNVLIEPGLSDFWGKFKIIQ